MRIIRPELEVKGLCPMARFHKTVKTTYCNANPSFFNKGHILVDVDAVNYLHSVLRIAKSDILT